MKTCIEHDHTLAPADQAGYTVNCRYVETWTAGQIADSNGAYSGREVRFTTQGIEVRGVLRYSNKSTEGPWAHLVVGEDFHVVNRDVTVEVA